MGAAQKPSSRPYSGALPSLWSNAQMDAAGRMDGPRATIARSEAVRRFSICILERSPEAEKTRSRVIGSPSKCNLRISSDCSGPLEASNDRERRRGLMLVFAQALQRAAESWLSQSSGAVQTGPLEMAHEIGNYPNTNSA